MVCRIITKHQVGSGEVSNRKNSMMTQMRKTFIAWVVVSQTRILARQSVIRPLALESATVQRNANLKVVVLMVEVAQAVVYRCGAKRQCFVTLLAFRT